MGAPTLPQKRHPPEQGGNCHLYRWQAFQITLRVSAVASSRRLEASRGQGRDPGTGINPDLPKRNPWTWDVSATFWLQAEARGHGNALSQTSFSSGEATSDMSPSQLFAPIYAVYIYIYAQGDSSGEVCQCLSASNA